MTYDNANTWTLNVMQVQQEDRGYYMCQINSNPMISQVGYLQVVGEYSFGHFVRPEMFSLERDIIW